MIDLLNKIKSILERLGGTPDKTLTDGINGFAKSTSCMGWYRSTMEKLVQAAAAGARGVQCVDCNNINGSVNSNPGYHNCLDAIAVAVNNASAPAAQAMVEWVANKARENCNSLQSGGGGK